jgi:hypothetical protein
MSKSFLHTDHIGVMFQTVHVPISSAYIVTWATAICRLETSNNTLRYVTFLKFTLLIFLTPIVGIEWLARLPLILKISGFEFQPGVRPLWLVAFIVFLCPCAHMPGYRTALFIESSLNKQTLLTDLYDDIMGILSFVYLCMNVEE